MIKVKDKNKRKSELLKNYKNLCQESVLSTGDKILSFSIPSSELQGIEEEGYLITKEDEFVIKQIEDVGNWTQVKAYLNLDELEGKPFESFETVNKSISDSLNVAIAGTGYTIAYCDVKRRRTVRKTNSSAWEIIREAIKRYRCEIKIDTLNKKLYIYEKLGEDKGTYFIENINLRSIKRSSNSSEFYTRIIPIGKDGLTIESVNGGKRYLENYQYSNKVKTFTWKDERYTDVESLKQDAEAKLEEMSKPQRSYVVEVEDLAKTNEDYDIFSFGLGDRINLISKKKNIKEKHRIVKLIEYPEEPYKNKCEISNLEVKFSDKQKEFQDAVDTVNNITSDDGTISEGAIKVAVENLTADKANIGQLNAVEANIGVLNATKANITELNAVKANVQELNATKASIKDLEATNIKVGVIEGDVSNFKFSTTDQLVALKANINNLFAQDANIINLVAAKADITELNAAVGNINILNTELATIQTLVNGNITSNNIQAGGITSDKLTIANGFIKSAMIDSLDVSKVNAGNISTNKFKIVSDNGGIEIVGATQQFKDKNNKVRIQMGQDNQGNFNFILRGEDGTTALIDHTGIKEKAIANDLIKGNMVATDAIGEKQINYSSLVTGLNKDTNTQLIKASKVRLDTTGQTLDVSFNQLKTNVDGMEVEGRNYVLNSKDVILETKENKMIKYRLSEDFIQRIRNKNITVSAYVQAKGIVLSTGHYGVDIAIHYKDGTTQWVNLTRGAGLPVDGDIEGKRYKRTTKILDKEIDRISNTDIFMRGVVSLEQFLIKDVKIELGTNATQFSYAPEDTKQEIDELNTQLSIEQGRINTAIENTKIIKNGQEVLLKDEYSRTDQTVNSINQLIGSHTTQIDGLNKKVETANSSITQMKGEIALKVSESQVIETVNEKVNEIKIGGRNYVKGTSNPIILTGNNTENQTMLIGRIDGNLIKGKKVTISFDWEVIEGVGTGNFRIQTGNNHYQLISNIISISKKKDKHIITIEILDNNKNFDGIFIRADNLIGKLKISNFQIEDGNKATDWSPAPEDIEGAISEKASKTDVYTKAETYTKEQTNSAITVAKNEINLGISNTYETKSNVISQITNVKTETINTSKAYADAKKSEAISSASTDATSKVNGVKNELNNKINNIDIGGTNLIKGSDIDISIDKNYNTNGYSPGLKVLNDGGKTGSLDYFINKEITLSFLVEAIGDYVKNGGGHLAGRFGCHGSIVWTNKERTKTSATYPCILVDNMLGKELTRVSVTTLIKTIPEGCPHIKEIAIAVQLLAKPAPNNDNIFRFARPKLELGNKATDWTPAPEDVKGEISEKASKTDVYTKKETYTIAQVDSAIKVAKESIELGVSNKYETKTNVENKIVTSKNEAVNKANEYTDTIKIGGTNLLSATDFEGITTQDFLKYWYINNQNNNHTIIFKKYDYGTNRGYDEFIKGKMILESRMDLSKASANNITEVALNPYGENSSEYLVLKPNTEYTLSYWAYKTQISKGHRVIVWGYDNDGSNRKSLKTFPITENYTGAFEKHELTFRTDSRFNYQIRLYHLLDLKKTGTSIIGFYQIKLEEGCKSTTWTPSSKDINSNIDKKANEVKAELNLEINEVKQNTSKLTVDLQAITGRVESTESKTSTLTTKVDKAQSDATNGVNKANDAINKANAAQGSANIANTTGTNALNKAIVSEELARAMSSGKMLYNDATFKKGNNDLKVYNNTNNGNVTITRISKPADCPTTSSHCLEVKTVGAAAPNFGGVFFGNGSRSNAIFITRIIAKIPAGRKIALAHNSLGTGGEAKWLSSQEGTGKYEEYICKTTCGSTGTFQSINYFHIFGGNAPTISNPLVWNIAYATVFDITDNDTTLQDTVIQVNTNKQQIAETKTSLGQISNKVSAVENSTKTIDGKVTNHETRLKSAENKITDSSIVNTIKAHQTNGKNTFAQTSQVEQTVNAVKLDFKSSGGFNMVENSTGMNLVKDGWGNTSGNNSKIVAGESASSKIISGYSLSIKRDGETDTAPNAGISRRFKMKPNTKYTISMWVNTSAQAKGIRCMVRTSNTVLHTDSENRKDHDDTFEVFNGASYDNWSKKVLTFTTGANVKSGVVYFDHTGYNGVTTGNNRVYWSCVMLVEGGVEREWSPHPNEVYSGNTKIDASGITVTNGGIVVKNKKEKDVMWVDSTGDLSTNKINVIGTGDNTVNFMGTGSKSINLRSDDRKSLFLNFQRGNDTRTRIGVYEEEHRSGQLFIEPGSAIGKTPMVIIRGANSTVTTNEKVEFEIHGKLRVADNITTKYGYMVGSDTINQILLTSKSDGTPYIHVNDDNGAYGITVWRSDAYLKERFNYSRSRALDKIMKIEHAEFDYLTGGHRELGVVAQQLQLVDKNWVLEVPVKHGLKETGEVVLQPVEHEIFPYVTKAIQEQQEEIEDLRKENQLIKNELNEIKKKLGLV